jgi:hypothetical protein
VAQPDHAAIQKAVAALLRLQQTNGGWGEQVEPKLTPYRSANSKPLHTAWVLRALQSVSGVPAERIYRARKYLENSLDDSGLLWTAVVPALPLPFGHDPSGLHDLTTLWALDAWAPLGDASRSRRGPANRSRSIFKKST